MDDFLDQAPFAMAEFADNPEPRCPCVLLLDVSGSMKGEPIEALNAGVQSFATALREDSLAAKRVEVGVITYGDDVRVLSEFTSAQSFQPRRLAANGWTPMGEAICTAIDLVAARQADYRTGGIASYRPWIFMITDGAPTDAWDKAARRIREGEERRKFSFYAVGVDGANMSTLAQISVNAPVMLRGLMFDSMFRWLSTSLSAVSRSSVGQSVPLANPAAPGGWAAIV